MVPLLSGEHRGLLACPLCRADLESAVGAARCCGCGELYSCESGIPRLHRPEQDAANDVTARVKRFYEETPFPDYEDLDSAASLVEKARCGLFARLLDEQIPANAAVLDAGCGTGQLASFLALSPGRTVVGADISDNSLELAQAFKLANRIDNVTFVQMDLFRPALAKVSFDLIVSNGVLHHTASARAGFHTLAELLRPGGYFVIGLYNTWGRLPTDVRRFVFRLLGDKSEGWQRLDPRLRKTQLGAVRRRSWFNDQYRHPHESKHSIGEVLQWFDSGGFEFVNAVPKTTPLARFGPDEQLFDPKPRGNSLDHALVQLGMAVGGGAEGGLFVMIGRKNEVA